MNLQLKGINFTTDIFFLLSAIVMLFLPNEAEYLPWIGFFLIPLSFHMLYKCRDNRFLAYVLVVIFLVNLSISVNDFILRGEHISVWQSFRMRSSVYNMMMAKSLLSFVAMFNLFLNGNILHVQTEIEELYNARKKNSLVVIVALIGLISILLYGVVYELPSHIDGYTSVSNPIYEYSIVIYVLAWLNAKKSFLLNKLLIGYACLFMLIFFYIGDRSSASMYLIFLLISQYKRKLNVIFLCLVGLIGIIFFNLLGIVRMTSDFSASYIFAQLLTRGIYSDTASWAYYSSITVVAAGTVHGHHLQMIFDFLQAIVGIKAEYANLSSFAHTVDSYNFFNRGGALFPSYFTAWFGAWGGFVAGIVLGIIIQKLFKNNKGLGLYYKLLTIVFIVRWYVYTPYVLFRSVLFVGGIVYLLYYVALALLKSSQKNTRSSYEH